MPIQREAGLWKEKWRSGNKVIMKNKMTGQERNVLIEPKFIKDGSILQPIGSQKDEYLKKYKELPNVPREETDKYLLRKGLLSLKDFEERKGGR